LRERLQPGEQLAPSACPKTAAEPVDQHRALEFGVAAFGRENVHVVAGRVQCVRHEPAIVAYAARLRRILTGDDRPCGAFRR
jgi:hypothetical protein